MRLECDEQNIYNKTAVLVITQIARYPDHRLERYPRAGKVGAASIAESTELEEEEAPGGGVGAWCRFGLKMSTRIKPTMMSTKRKMHFRRPVFFWYLCENR